MPAKTKRLASQDRLATLERALDALPVAFALFDAKGALTEWNARLAKLKLFPKRLLKRGTTLARFRAHDAGVSRRAAKPRTLRLPEGGTLKVTATRIAPGQLLVTYQDVTEARRVADRLALERAHAETAAALERQTATAEILKVIAGSPTDVQPVFEAIARSAERLFEPWNAAVVMREGDLIHLRAVRGPNLQALEKVAQMWPIPFDPDTVVSARAIANGRFVEIADTERTDVPQLAREMARKGGYRAAAFMPLLRDGMGIGAIILTKVDPGSALTENQIALLRTFADQAVIAIENVRLFNQTKEALERQTATAEILKVIASSPADVQPVFDAIVRSCHRLLAGHMVGLVLRKDGMLVPQAGVDGSGKPTPQSFVPPWPLDRGSASGACILDRRPFSLPDITQVGDQFPRMKDLALRIGMKSGMWVPLMREGEAIGVLAIPRVEKGGFGDKELALAQTFADQAVIAIENVRLLNETREALQHQTATAEVLQVISGSVADAKPVFDKILASCRNLFGNCYVTLGLLDDDGRVHLHQEPEMFVHPVDAIRKATEMVRDAHPRPSRESIYGYVAYKRQVMHVPNVQYGPGVPEGLRKSVEILGGNYAALYAPLLWEGRGIGTLCVSRVPPAPFSEKEIRLLKTFADQAVIAIQNARLFNETKEALERQTATAEILKVIASSPSDVQPVLDAIAASAKRMTNAMAAVVLLTEGGMLHLGAATPIDPVADQKLRESYPQPVAENSYARQMLETRAPVRIVDAEQESEEWIRSLARARGWRSLLGVPLHRGDEVIGGINISRREPGPFSEHQVGVIQTFADQAVIAIENVRLFKELQSRTDALTKSVGQLTALGEVGQAISSTLDLDKVLPTIVSRAVQLTGLDGCAIYEYDEAREVFVLRAGENIRQEILELDRSEPIRIGDGAIGRAAATRQLVQVPDIAAAGGRQTRGRDVLLKIGARALLAVPLVRDDHVLGALAVIRNRPGDFAPEVVALLETFATQSAIAIQNARLFREIEDKGRQLEIASQHKSQFLASMSHELRTPLNAILGFNEMVLDEVYGGISADVRAPLQNMQASGKHLLRLINNVLDLAKIEAGRMELALADYSVHDVVASVSSTLQPLAAEKGLEFAIRVPDDLPLAHGDAGRMSQCLLNLAGNSLKFTRQGRVAIEVGLEDGRLLFSVADTGIGIPPEKIESLFTEFKQTDATIASEYGGSGLGLSITKKFIEMHGGRIWVESEPGKGSTFRFEVPVRAGP